jgi:hypothetical protein
MKRKNGKKKVNLKNTGYHNNPNKEILNNCKKESKSSAINRGIMRKAERKHTYKQTK